MNILAIGAHFDDVEIGCSGTLMKLKDAGHNILLVVVTDSAYKNPKEKVIRDKETALKEGKKAAELMGVKLLNLNFPTFEVHFDEELTRKLTEIIEDEKVEMIFAPWVHDIHRDHANTGKAALMAGRHIPKFLFYRANFYDTYHQFNGRMYFDISEYMERKIEVIRAHKSELERVRYSWIEFIKNQNRNEGQKIGVKYAEVFEIVRYLL